MNLKASRVYIRLTEFLFKCVRQDVNYSIAKQLIHHIEEFPDIYIEEIAYHANTTPASVTKFCKRIGYNSFKEMRMDIQPYTSEAFFLDKITTKTGVENAVAQFIHQDQQIQKHIFTLFDQTQCTRIAQMIQPMKKIAIFGNTYSFSAVNLFRELFSQLGYTVYEVNRRSSDEVLAASFKDVDAAFVISLTGDWVDKNQAFLTNTNKPLFLLTHSKLSKYSHVFEEIIQFDQYEFLLSSNYYSQKVIYSWVILLSICLRSL